MTHTRTAPLTPRAALIAHVLTLHHRAGAHTCRCGYTHPLGVDTTVHTADAVDAALLLLDDGLALDRALDTIDPTRPINPRDGHTPTT